MRTSLAVLAVVLVAVVAFLYSRAATPPAPESPGSVGVAGENTVVPTSREIEDAAAERPRAPAIPAGTTSTPRAVVEVLVVEKEDENVPVAGVTIVVHAIDARHVETTTVASSRGSESIFPTTGVDGRATLDLPAERPFAISARTARGSLLEGQVRVLEPLATGTVERITLHVSTDAELVFHGLVVDEAGAPIRDARVMRCNALGPHGTFEIEVPNDELVLARTDADGRFRVALEPRRSASLLVEADGFSMRAVTAGRTHSELAAEARIALARAGILAFRAEDVAGSPIRDGTLRLTNDVSADVLDLRGPDDEQLRVGPWPKVKRRSALDAGGRCTIEVPGGAPLALELFAGVRELRRQPSGPGIEAGTTRELTWRIGTGCRVTGEIVDQLGSPVVQQDIWLVGGTTVQVAPTEIDPARTADVVDRTRSDGAGRFALDDVAPGSWKIGAVCAWQRGCDIFPVASTFEVVDGTSEVHVVVRVERGVYVEGIVEDPDGAPIQGVWVRAHIELPSVRTDSNGRFRIGPMKPTRTLLALSCSCPFVLDTPFEVDAAVAGPVVIRMRRGASISGRVVDESGAPVVGRVQIDWSVKNGGGGMFSRARERGAFELNRISPGRYTLRATVAGEPTRCGLRADVEVAEGESVTDVVIRIREVGTIVIDGAGSTKTLSVSALVDGVEWVDASVGPIARSSLSVPHGKVVLRVVDEELATDPVELELDVAPGETRTVDARMLGG